MTVHEQARHELHTKAEAVFGPEIAGTLMSYLPPVGWADVATKHDLVALRNEFAALLHSEITNLRGEVNDLRGEVADVRREFAAVLREEIAALERRLEERFDVQLDAAVARLETRVLRDHRDQTRLMVFGMFGSMAAFAGVVSTVLVVAG